MNNEYIISFENDKNYQRFNATHIITRLHRNMAVIELCEECVPNADKYIIRNGEDFESVNSGSDLINIVHGTMIVQPDQLFFMIQSLQQLYDDYINKNKSSKGD